MHACALHRAIDGNEREVRHEDRHADGKRSEHSDVNHSLVAARIQHSKDGEHQQRSCYELSRDLWRAKARAGREDE